MEDKVFKQGITPILFPYNPDQFWATIRTIVREEVTKVHGENNSRTDPNFTVNGMSYKPLFKMSEICSIFQVTKPTIYDWIKHEKLKPFKIRTRVYFLWDDIQQLLKATNYKIPNS